MNPDKPEAQSDAQKKDAHAEEDQKLQNVADDFMNKERIAAGNAITPDVEYQVGWIDDSLGYLPFLENLLKEMEDKDEWTGDGSHEAQLEKNLLQSTAQAIRRNLQGLSKELDASPRKSGKAYEHLRSVYLERSKRYTELMASVNEEEENVELRDAPLAMQQAQEMLPHMSMEEAIDWVEQTLSAIDGNDWQSNGLKETYGLLINTCKKGLQKKLDEEKAGIGEDPAKASNFCRHAMDLSKLFTDRGSPIDSDLTDIDFAESMAKDAMGFEMLAMRFAEKTLKRANPLKQHIDQKKDEYLSKLLSLPDEKLNTPQVQKMVQILNGNPLTIDALSAQYVVLRSLEISVTGESVDLNQEAIDKMASVMEGAYAQFETFLDGTMGGSANLEEINAAIGEPGMTAMQIEGWTLLADIQGYGYDIGDRSWSNIAMGAKITAMIVAGAAIGAVTAGAGLGIIGAALAGGAAMTASNAIINQQGFDNLDDALKVYGKDFAVNTSTMGAARYLAAGRAAFQLSRAGLLQNAGGLGKVLSIAGQKGGMKLIGSLDDASGIGTRLMGATGEGAADVLLGTTLDTAITGGEFMENLRNNAMFFGLSFGMEFGGQGAGNIWKKLRGLPNEDLHGLAQTANTANLQRMNIQKLTGGISIEELLGNADPSALLKQKGLTDADLKTIVAELDGLKKTKAEFEAAFAKAAALPDIPATDMPGIEKPLSRYFHQTQPEGVESIVTNGFELRDTGAGHEGPIRGVFLKEDTNLISGSGIGTAQVSVEVNPSLNVLNLCDQMPPSFAKLFGAPPETYKGDQNYAVAGWLEQNGYKTLAEEYYEAANQQGASAEPLNRLWPQVLAIFQEKGVGAVKFIDAEVDDKTWEMKKFPATVILNPKDIARAEKHS